MIQFTYFKNYLVVTMTETDLPATMVKCASSENEEILKTAQSWLDAMGLADREYQVLIRIH